MDTRTKLRKWVKALRSGNYKQSKNRLKSKNGYCCMGVARELFNPENFKLKDAAPFLLDDKEVCSLFGMKKKNPNNLRDIEPLHEIQGRLASMNDHGVPFEVIAGTIKYGYNL